MEQNKDDSHDKRKKRRHHHNNSHDDRSDDSDCERFFIEKEVRWQMLKGDPGKRGDRGRAGPKGDQGVQGCRGERGAQGERGKRGKRGDHGPEGCRGKEGEPGCQGERGKRGKRGVSGHRGKEGKHGDHGKSTILGFAQGINSAADTTTIPVGGFVNFDVVYHPSPDILINGDTITLVSPGTYNIEYYIRGIPADVGSLSFCLLANATTIVPGSVFVSALNSSNLSGGSLEVRGSTIAKFPDIEHGIFSGANTTLQLNNISGLPILRMGVANNVVNGYITILRIA